MKKFKFWLNNVTSPDGTCMAGEMASVFNFCPDTLLAGFKLWM